ncbi:MAG: DNA-directed RNA polymerase subunit B'', partial [Nanoarchaeota archaeon]
MEKQEHILIKKYLEQHSLVESNITSFNNFIEHRMQQIVSELGDSMSDEEIKIKLGKIRIEKPIVIEADGSMKKLTPAEARLRNLTYSSPVFLEISVNYEGHIESHEVEIGKIPVIVKSKACHMNNMNHEELEKNFMDPLDPGGYFIVNGNERVMVMAEDLAANQPFIEENSKGQLALRIFSQRGAYRIPVTLLETNEGILEVSFSRFKNIPAMVMLKALGMLKEAEISRLVAKENDSFIVNLYEFATLQNTEDALMSIAEKAALQGTKKEIVDRVKQRIDSYFMPHIGMNKEDRIEKAITLCKLIRQLYLAKENNIQTDKDHYANKRVRLSGDLLSDLFRVNLNVLLRDLKYSLQKISKRKKFYSLKTIAKSTLFSHIIESAIATGNWIGERTGVTQNMDKTNYLAILSQLQRVASMLPGEQENFLARTLHPTHYGRFCPIETPEGTEIGLRKNLAIMSKISTAILIDEKNFVLTLEELGLKREKEGVNHGEVDVFFNGRFIGSVGDGVEFAESLRKKRRENDLPIEMSVRHDAQLKIVFISTEVGRVLRPLIVVANKQSAFTDRHKEMFEEGKLNWNDLVQQGIIEYVDAAEEENALVALSIEDINERATHLEIDKIDLLG